MPPHLADHLRCGYTRVVWQLGASDNDQLASISCIEDCNLGDPPAATTHRLTLHGEYGIVTHYLVTFVPPGEHEVQAREEGEVAHVLGKAATLRGSSGTRETLELASLSAFYPAGYLRSPLCSTL